MCSEYYGPAFQTPTQAADPTQERPSRRPLETDSPHGKGLVAEPRLPPPPVRPSVTRGPLRHSQRARVGCPERPRTPGPAHAQGRTRRGRGLVAGGLGGPGEAKSRGRPMELTVTECQSEPRRSGNRQRPNGWQRLHRKRARPETQAFTGPRLPGRRDKQHCSSRVITGRTQKIKAQLAS